MKRDEYEAIQARFSKKLLDKDYYGTKKEEAYNNGILACKSMLKDHMKHWSRLEEARRVKQK